MRLYLWDYRNPAASDYLLHTRLLGELGLASKFVDGFFTDDPTGLGQEHPQVVARIGYGIEEATECRAAQVKALRRAQEALVARGAFDWQLFTQVDAVTNKTCLARMREWCSPPRYQMRVAWQMNVYSDWQKEIHQWPTLPDLAQRLAAFLLARGPFAWFGYGFAGCDFPVAPEFLHATKGVGPLSLELGEPSEDCHEEAESSGVFVRRWSSGKSTRLDCNSWTATTLTHPPLKTTDNNTPLRNVLNGSYFVAAQLAAAAGSSPTLRKAITAINGSAWLHTEARGCTRKKPTPTTASARRTKPFRPLAPVVYAAEWRWPHARRTRTTRCSSLQARAESCRLYMPSSF